MSLVKVYFQHREGGVELVEHERDLKSHRQACEIIDKYPWAEELKLFEELGEGGGFFFVAGDLNGQYASFQFAPMEKDDGLLDLKVVYKKGFLGIFGRKSVSVDFKLVSIAKAKQHLKELFDYPIESLYRKYKA